MGLPDTTGTEGRKEFPAIKAGWYEMILLEQSGGHINVNQDEYTKLTFQMAEGNQRAWTNLTHNEMFMWQIKQLKDALKMSDSEPNLDPYIGTHLMVYLRNKEKDGKNQAEVREFKPMDGVPKTEIEKANDDDDFPF